MGVSALSSTTVVSQISAMRARMEDLQVQLTTQKKSTTYAGLGAQRGLSVSFRQQMSTLDAFSSSIDLVSTRLELMDTALTRMGKIPAEVKSSIDPNSFVVLSDGKTGAQKTAQVALQEMIGLFNTDAAGRYLFAGNETAGKPVVDYDTLMNGTDALAGFSDYVAERKMADLGADGLGRLAVDSFGGTVTLGKAAPATSVFGFTVTSTSGDLSNVAASVSGDPAELVVDFTGQPNTGESMAITLTNPDGSTSTITMKAVAGPDAASGEFVVGATEAETADNFAAALTAALAKTAASDLAAASAMAAADNFFDTAGGALPRRVDTGGGSAYDATDLVDADPATSVIWYTGQNDASPAREGVTARIDTSITVSYGARANEESLANLVKSLAALAVESFDESVSTDEARYAALAERVDSALGFPNGKASPQDLHTEIAIAAQTTTAAEKRHVTTKAALVDMVSGIENADTYEVSAQLLQLQTQLQASYQTTSIMYQLSLVNYL